MERRPAVAAYYMLLTVLLFSIGDAATQHLTRIVRIDVTVVLTLRTVVGIGLLLFMAALERQLPRAAYFIHPWSLLRTGTWVIGVIAFATGFKYGTLTEVYIIAFTAPLISLAIAALRRRRPSIWVILAACVMFGGVLMFHAEKMHFGEWTDDRMKATIAAVICAFMYAFFAEATELQNESVGEGDEYAKTLAMLACGLAGLLIAGAVIGLKPFPDRLPRFDSSTTLIIAVAGLASAGGIVLMTVALRYDLPSRVLPYDYCVIIPAVFFDWWSGSALPTALQVTAILVVLAGAILLSRASEKS